MHQHSLEFLGPGGAGIDFRPSLGQATGAWLVDFAVAAAGLNPGPPRGDLCDLRHDEDRRRGLCGPTLGADRHRNDPPRRSRRQG